jgi:CRP-like cAMP-binding protein
MDFNLSNLCDFGEQRNVKSGEELYKENTPVDGFCYLVLSGQLEEKKTFTVENAFIRDISVGDVAGVVELFSDDKKRLATLKAVKDSTVYVWSKSGIREIATSNLQFCLYIIRNLSTTLRGLNFELKELLLRK